MVQQSSFLNPTQLDPLAPVAVDTPEGLANTNDLLAPLPVTEAPIQEVQDLPEYQSSTPSKVENKTADVQKKLGDKTEQITGKPQGSDGLARLLGSATLTTAADLADSAVELGSNIVGGLADFVGRRDLYTKEDQAQAATFLDSYAKPEFGDSVTGYDRSNYAATQKEVGDKVEKGEYLSAFISGATIAPELVAESLPYIATLGIGGKLKVVTQAGKVAGAEVLALGGTKAAAKAASNAAIKTAEKGLNLAKATANLGAKNAGLLAMSATQTKNQNEEFAKNNNGEGMSALQMTRATAINTFMNALERASFKTITGLGKNKTALKEVWGQMPKASKNAVKKKVAGLAADMSKEAGQEYLQTWGEIVNENWGAKDRTLSSVLGDKKLQDEAITAGILGSTSGGLMSAPKTVGGVLNEVGKAKQERIAKEASLSSQAAGFNSQADKDKSQTKIDKDYETIKGGFETLSEAETSFQEVAKDTKTTDTEKVSKVQDKLSELGVGTDSVTDTYVTSFGETELNNVVNTLNNNPSVKTSESLQKTISDVAAAPGKSNTAKIKALGNMVDMLQDSATDADRKVLSDSQTSLDRQASKLVKDGRLNNITFEQARKQLNQKGIATKGLSETVKSRKDPKIYKDVDYDQLSKLDGDQLAEKLSEYDNKSLTAIMKEAKTRTKEDRKISNAEARNANISKTRKLYTAVKNAITGTTKAAKGINKATTDISKAAKNTFKQRKDSKALYDPKASISETIKKFITDAKDGITKAYNDVKEGKKVDKHKFKESAKATIAAVTNIDKVEDIDGLKDTIDKLESIGVITEVRMKSLNKKIDDYLQTKKEEDAKDTNEDVSTEETTATETTVDKTKRKTKETVDKVKETVGEDTQVIYDKILNKLGEVDLKKSYETMVKTVSSADYAGMYQTLKDLGTLDKNKHDVNVVDSIDGILDNKEVC